MIFKVDLNTGESSLSTSEEVRVEHLQNLNMAFDWAVMELTKSFREEESLTSFKNFLVNSKARPIPNNK